MSSSQPKLLDQVRALLRSKHYSRRTEQSYIDWITRYVRFHQLRHPRELGATDIAAFLTHLAVDRVVAAATQNQARSALLFFYLDVLGRYSHHHDLHSRAQPRRPRRAQPARRAGTRAARTKNKETFTLPPCHGYQCSVTARKSSRCLSSPSYMACDSALWTWWVIRSSIFSLPLSNKCTISRRARSRMNGNFSRGSTPIALPCAPISDIERPCRSQ